MTKNNLKIYFAGSIRGGREYVPIYQEVIKFLAMRGEVLTEHIGNKTLSSYGETGITEEEIYKRDMSWLQSADLIVADVSIHSTGVGYEIGQAESMGKNILCLYHKDAPRKISGMIAGDKKINLIIYDDVEDLLEKMKEFFKNEK
ncbi:MAG: nucleoside 2-deoxyribosyltransferase [bacterium]